MDNRADKTIKSFLQYYEQELLFLSLRFGILKSKKPPKKGLK